MTKTKKVKEWRVGDSITVQMANEKESKTGEIERIDKVIKIGDNGDRRQWATILVPAVLRIDKCTHDILQRRLVNLLIYKLPKARKTVVEPKPAKKKAKEHKGKKPSITTGQMHDEKPGKKRLKFKCCGHPSTMGHADDCPLKEGGA